MDAFVMVDWSAAADRAPAAGRPDGLWAAVAQPGADDRVMPFRTRHEARERLVEELLRLLDAGHRVLLGLDLSLGYPAGTARALGMPSGATPWRWMWERVAREVRDADDGRNDRFAAAARLNLAMDRDDGPFWGNGLKADLTGLPRTKGAYPITVADGVELAELRATEQALRDAGHHPSSTWQLAGAGSVGGQVLVGLPALWRIRNHPALRDRCRVWPFEVQDPLAGDAPGVVIAEVYPSLLPDDPDLHEVRDARQVLALVDGYRQMAADGALADAFALPGGLDAATRDAVLQEEGWILPVVRDPARPRTPARRSSAPPTIPRDLVEAIAAGTCVAVVGSGFAAPEVPSWEALIADLADDPAVPAQARRQVAALLAADGSDGEPAGSGSQRPALHGAAQLLAHAVPAAQLRSLLRDRLAGAATAERIVRRRELLLGIPFAAVVTTAVDPSLPGMAPGPEAHAAVLRAAPAPWWDDRRWQVTDAGDGGSDVTAAPPPVLKLHGDLADPDEAGGVDDAAADEAVRAALHLRPVDGDGPAEAVLRALLATRTVLHLGTTPAEEALLDRLRAEVLALVGHDPRRQGPLAYAVLPDVSPAMQAFQRDHRGLEVLTYDSRDPGRADAHEGFDELLAALHARAGHDALLRRAAEGRTILWVDPPGSANEAGIQRLGSLLGDEALVRVGGPSEARAVLRSRAVDLVVTHWGHREGGRPVGEEVLNAVRTSRHRCPTLVFAWGDYADVNRPQALALGASDYVWTWPALFREVARVLAPAPRHPWDLAPQLEG